MARDYFDESKKKKKKKQEVVAKKPQPSSASVNKSIQQAQDRGRGRTENTNVKAQQTYKNTRTINPPAARTNRSNTPATASEMRRKNAQNQKSTAGVTREQQEKTKQRFSTAKEMMNARAEEGRKQKMGENSVATKEQKKTVERAIRNTPSVVKKAALDAGSGYMQTLTEIADMTASSETGARAKAMKLGYEYNDTEGLAKVKEERRRTVKAAREDNKKLHEAQKKRQEEFDKKTKGAKGLEKAYYGALESGTGMLADIGIGAITGTGQAGSLASMYMRTFGSSTNQARDEGATDKEARRYGFWQANKEVGTELMFPGTGLVKKAYGKAGLPLAERAANRLIKGLSGRAADVTHTGLRLGLGTGEEVAEEGAGWLLDPVIKEFTYGKNVRKREAQEVMNRISEDMRSKIKDENDAASASAYLSSDTFLEDTKKDYMEEGLSEKEAEVVANKMRDFLTASLTGDTETMERLEDEISKDVANAHNILEDYSGKELLETIASTSLLTVVFGLPGSVTSSMRGAALRDELGEKGIRALAKTAIDFEDETDSYKGQAARDRLDSGKELTSTQVYELAEATQKQIEKDSRRQEASVDSASKRIKAENLIAPYGVNANGEMVIDDVINEKFETNAKTAETTIKNFDANREEGQKSLTDTAVRNGSRAIARWKAGVFTVEDANELNYSNTAVRSAFEEETGVDLGQYVVKDKNGKVDIPKTNAATKDALFAMASDNLVESAREATVNWMDNVKGEVVSQVTARMGAEGSLALQSALDDVDERNRSEYMMVANASDMLYQSALNIGTEWDNVKAEATKMFPNISENKLQAMYEAGLEDRDMATDKYRGKSVRLGESLANLKDSDKANVTGKVFVDTETPLKGTIVRAFTEIANNLGVDIHLVDNLPTDSGQQANGMYDKGTIYINVNSSFEQNMGYIFMHEVTHHLKEYAPEEYAALERLVREKWFEYDDAQMQSEIAKKIELYSKATKGKQTLTEEEALEEIIADAAHEFLNDPNFANEVADDNPSLAKAVLESIRNALRMLRRILSTGSIDDETHMNSLFSQLDIFDEAERLWLNAYRTATANKAALAIDNWQDEVNAQSGAKESLSLSDSNLTVQGNTARWTDSRIDSLIRENGASDERYSKAWAAMMSPRDFLKLTIDDGTLEKWMQDENETMPLDKEKLRGEGQTPFLIIDDTETVDPATDFSHRVTGHEGRHRMIALMNAGVESVPVVVRGTEATKYKKTSIPELTLAAQNYFGEGGVNDEARVNALDLVPIKESNRDELIEKFGGEADVRFSISEQQDTDYMKAVESGDMETAQRMVDEAAEKAMPNSILREGGELDIFTGDTEEGKLVKMYHGSGAKDFYEFKLNDGALGKGAYFTSSPEEATEYAVFASDEINENDDWQYEWNDTAYDSIGEIGEELEKQGYVRAFYLDIEDSHDLYISPGLLYAVARNRSQIKSADPVTYDDAGNVIPLSQRFNSENNDVRYSLDSGDIMNTLEENFNEYKEDKQNLRIATEALDDLQRSRYSLDSNDASGRWDGGIQVRTTGKGITTSLINEGRLDFRGQTVKSPEDLAKLCQVLRDPRFETFRVVLTKGDKIVSFRSISSRLPGLSRAFETDDLKDSIEIVRDRMNRLGADGYYLIHNHPSGNVNASFEDLSVTRAYLALLGQDTYKGHIILDHDEYGFIDAAIPQQIHGENFPTPRIEPITGQQTIDFLHEPEIDHPVLGSKIKNSQDVANIAQTINTSDGVSVLLYTSSQSKVRGIQEISNKALKNNKEISGYIRNQAIEEFGTPAAFLYTTDLDTYNRGKELISEGVLMDAVIGYGFKTQDGGLIESGRANVSEVGETGHLGLDEEGFNKRTKVFESASGLREYDAIRYSITPKMDADYMDAVNTGNMEEAQKLVDEAAKAAMPNTKTPGLWLHGTENEFTVFDFSQGGKNGTAEGFGIYLARDRDVSEHYGKLMIEGYVNIEKPASSSAKTINKSTLKKLIKATVEQEANRLAEDYDNDVEAAKRDTWISNYAYTYDKSLDASISEVADSILEMNFSDMEIVQEVMAGMAIRDYDEAVEFYDLLTDITGFDGFTTTWENKALEGTRDIALAFRSNQIKSAETVTYADDGSIIPLSERFNPENDDIRYSLPTQNSQGNILSDGQMEYFKNSQARDSQGRLVPVFHTTRNGGFTIFDPSFSDDRRSLFFTDKRRMSESYSRQDGRPTGNIDPYNPGANVRKIDDVNVLPSFDSSQEEEEIRNRISNISVKDANGVTVIEGDDFIETAIKIADMMEAEGYELDIDFGIRKDRLVNDTGWQMGEAWEVFNNAFNLNLQYTMDYEETIGTYTCYLNLENPLIIDCANAYWNSILEDGFKKISTRPVPDSENEYFVTLQSTHTVKDYVMTLDQIAETYDDEMARQISEYDWANTSALNNVDFYTYGGREYNPEDEGLYPQEGDTRFWCDYAWHEGYDGVIFENVRDYGDSGYGNEPGNVYVAFGSNQVKDINNENPTENPDIRFSITPEDEAKSKMAYEYALDDSYEALEYYEQRLADLTDEAAENRPVKRFSEEKIEEFYAGLRSTDSWVHTDPIAEEDAVRMANSKKDFFANLNAKWNDRWTTGGEVLNVKSVKTDVRNLVMGVMQNSDTDSKYRNDLVKKTLFDVRTAFQLMKQDRPEVASALLYHSAQRMIDNVQFYVDGTFDQYKDLKHYLRTTKISLGEEYWSDVDYDAFRKRNYNRINLVKGSTNVDQVYQELEEMFPEFFNEEEVSSAPDQLLQIEHVLDSVQPYKEAYSSEEAAALAFDIADDLYEIMVNGDEVRSLADRYKDRYDAKTRAMKQRHAEAMLRVRKARDEGIKAEKARFAEYKEKQKEKKLHAKHFGRINENYKWLKERLLTNTKDKHIPEQYKKDLAGLLSAFDLQTVGSKKLEAKRGYQSQRTIQMSAIRSGLDAMHKAYETFFVHDAITDKIDALASQVDGKTIDELSVDQLSEIDDILRGLKSDFINYDKVMVKGKQRAAAEAGKAQTKGALDHADKFGPGKDYQNLPGVIDKLINLDEMTAPYLFRKIDPKNEGLGMMYGEIRRGFDKYVRNQNQLNDWMDEIVGKYHQKGILWNKYGSGELSDWRSDTHAVTFNFEHGPVRLTPAQMMSIYCLAKRPQAYQHMISEYGGIVVAPVTFNAKILSDQKKNVNTALSVPLNDADIKQIIAELTPDQIQVAEKLQELMATKMADWGNEASMDVMGIELFREREYFPIKSDSAVLQKDLNDSEFVQAIRNFGFTKALTPNANNAIVVEDIFDVVTEHCNNMNLYNAYSKAFDDFMKVYNYKDFGEGGTGYTVQQAVAHAYSKKATTFIMTFLRDLNGNVSGRASGIEDAYNSLLGNAKKAAVFANLRVAAQQPTAITRAFYVIDPRYMKGIKIEKGAMTEMFEHCPIALWKSWGYYDINMGKSIEDIMMNNGRWLEDKATDLYGALDNVTWTAIWQMVKNEMKDTHPDVKEGTDEYWDLCNERMSEVVDLTQVVDSPLHRSHAMRDKGFLKKTATSFMAEPTLTFNMLRDGCERSAEAKRMGKILLAGQIASRTIAVALFQAVTVAGAAGLVDALRKKKPDKDDEDDSFLHLWWVNALENFKDELKVWNKIYFIKDIASLMEGWDNANLALQGIQKFSLGFRQLQGDPYARSSASWYENMADGLGYMFGVPVKTMRTGIKNVMEALGITSPIIDATKESLDAIADNNKKKQKEEKGTMVGKMTSDEFKIEGKGLFGKLLKKADEKETGTSEAEAEGKNTYEEERDRLRDLEAKAKEKTQGLTGKELDDALWDVLSDGYTKELDAGNLDYIEHLELIYMNAGGDTELFRAKIKEKIGSSYKKTFADNMSQEDLYAQDRMRHYMEELLDFSEDEVSAICYKTDKARDLKVAFRLNNEQYINDEMSVLVRAGLTQADLEKLYKNRNRMNLKTYNGKYKDQLKSTGNYVFPVDGVITSDFGHRASPGGIGSTNHQGIDIGAKSGTPVGAADGGTVVMAGWYGGYGKTVQVKHDDGTITQYSHLSWWDVNEGDTVAQGQEIGLVGSTGNSTGPHLHLGVIKDGNYVDPKQYFNTRDKSWAADA